MARSGYMPLTAAVIFAVGAAGMACTRSDNRAANDRDRDRTAMSSPSPSVTDNANVARNDNENRVNNPDAGDIENNPAKYAGQHVALKADVKELMPNGFFVLDDHDMLVLSPSGQPGEKEKVTVSGTVQTYSAPEFKRKYAWFKSNPQIDTKYKDRAVIIADSIMTADGRELLNTSALPASSGELNSKVNRDRVNREGHGNKPADSRP
jgi:hypothetical protein